MKAFFMLIATLFAVHFASFAQNKSKLTNDSQQKEDKIRQYWFVMLIKGENRSQDSATAAKIQKGHMANIRKLYNEGKLKVAGPFGDEGNWRGIFIFDCDKKEELENLLRTDPAIASGRLNYEIHPWYTLPIGSFKPGLPEKTN